MIRCTSIGELRQRLAEQRKQSPDGRIGLVPTMGFLHEGHASLMRRADEECDFNVLSVFVNPLQFGPNEDFDRYPRDIERDAAIAEKNGIDILFMPSVQEMYPTKPLTRVLISDVTDRLCGASRPGHFDGVGTVVSKLFNLVQPTHAYFGMKDAQQVAVVEQMVHDLNIQVEIVRCETVREADGLAMSSRNMYLNEDQRQQAVILSQTLREAGSWLQEAGMSTQELTRRIQSSIETAPLAVIDYAEVLTYPSLSSIAMNQDLSQFSGTLIIALAVKFGSTRLIDNRVFELQGGGVHVQNDDEIEAAQSNSNRGEPQLCG
ncbi:pantoate--beta-alanine ligase [Paenibacillus sp. OV219]|uniref:pantoate--beta-alanine ligase n=1 Tax=Paenibacillus sp. OV219 TaxID=1884377 RepID=UPI0008AD2B38|nr:pantoate--beta-alanine ligase [Paenibacillus sp. OV219]SEN26866.1 pantothenate synthetase [Paenibacillus sp. OV219]